MKAGYLDSVIWWEKLLAWLGRVLREPEIDTALAIINNRKCLWGTAHCHKRSYAANLHQQGKKKKKKQPTKPAIKRRANSINKKAVRPPTTDTSRSLTLPPVVSCCCLWFQDYQGPPQCSSCHRALSPCVVLQIPCQ